MKARHVMVSPVLTIKTTSSVREAAEMLLKHRISALPVLNDQGHVVGIVSEGDLLHRAEADTVKRRSWWLEVLTADDLRAAEYTKARARKVSDIMSRPVITASPDTPVHEIAGLLEKNGIKRVPIVKDGQLVGIVSRANLIQAVASRHAALEMPLEDASVRDKLLSHLNTQSWAHTALINVTVKDGVVDLWGFARSDAERQAIRVAAETMAGVRAVNDHLTTQRIVSWS